MHASCESPWHSLAKQPPLGGLLPPQGCLSGACCSHCEVARNAELQGLTGYLYIRWCFPHSYTVLARRTVTPMYRGRRQGAPGQQQRREVEQQQRHAAWVTIYEAIHTLHAQGLSVTTIAEQLGVSRPTVYAYLRRATPPSPRSPQRSGQVLRPSMAYLIQRWREGCTDSMQLWRELRARGYGHSARTVSRFLTRLRRASEAGWAPETQTSPSTRPQGPSARAVSFTWVCPEAKRT